jgi:hypothetical protein
MTSEILKDLAEKVYESHGCGEIAIAEMVRLISTHPEAIGEAVKLASYQALLQAQHLCRRKIEQAPVARTYSSEQQASITRACRGMLAWPMMNGSELGKATRGHLKTDAARYAKNADGNWRKSRFLSIVADKVPEGSTVEQVLTEQQLAEIFDRVKRLRKEEAA